MELNFIKRNNTVISEVISDRIVINNLQDALDLIADCDYNYSKKIILSREHIISDFYDLKTKLAGEILQKFTNYGVEVAIIGDFSQVTSKSLNDFIYECNMSRKVNFLKSKEEAIDILST